MRMRSVAPVLLLLAVVAGLFTMHTVGHLSSHGTAPHTATAPAAESHDGYHGQLLRMVAAHGGPHGLPGDLTALCVAILCAVLTIAVALTLLRRPRSQPVGPAGRAWATAASSRGPPRSGIGLRIADLSVLRN